MHLHSPVFCTSVGALNAAVCDIFSELYRACAQAAQAFGVKPEPHGPRCLGRLRNAKVSDKTMEVHLRIA